MPTMSLAVPTTTRITINKPPGGQVIVLKNYRTNGEKREDVERKRGRDIDEAVMTNRLRAR